MNGAARASAAPARRTPSGEEVDTALLRGFLRRALGDEALLDRVEELLFEHVVEERLHQSVVADELSRLIGGLLAAATAEDWRAVAGGLIADAREMDGGPEKGATRPVGRRRPPLPDPAEGREP